MYSMTEVIVAYWHGYRGKNIKVYVCCDLMFPESMNEYYIAYWVFNAVYQINCLLSSLLM